MASDNFVDYVKIHCKSGNGGGGSMHYRREKYIPLGGPDGGDGGIYARRTRRAGLRVVRQRRRRRRRPVRALRGFGRGAGALGSLRRKVRRAVSGSGGPDEVYGVGHAER